MRTIQVAATTLLLCTASEAALAGALRDADPAAGAEWRRRGLALGYNLDHADAMAAFQRAIQADPDSPAGYRLLAATAWTILLFEQGAITVDDFLGEARKDYRRSPPRADLASAARIALDRAISLAERQLKERPNDAAAHYHAGAAYSFRAAYTATIEGRLFASLGAARRAYREHERLLSLDPSRKDAGLIVGAAAARRRPRRLRRRTRAGAAAGRGCCSLRQRRAAERATGARPHVQPRGPL